MLTYALYTAADWAPCRGLGPGPGRCITLLKAKCIFSRSPVAGPMAK